MALTRYDLDLAHSTLGFSVRHLMITNVVGVFTRWSGSVSIDHDAPEKSQISLEIDASSVDTRQAQRDGHLRSPEFFDVEHFPTITFVGKEVVPDGQSLRLSGDFTLRGVTKPLTFVVLPGGQAKDSQGRTRVGYHASSKISRKAFGVSWNAIYEGGSVVVDDEVALSLDLQLIPSA